MAEKKSYDQLHFATKVVHAGCEPDGVNNVIVPPISLGTTFCQSFPGVKPGMDDPNSHGTGFFYSRQANPTRGALERAICSLDHGKHCCAFASGMAAIHGVMALLKAGDHVLALNDLYGGTVSLFRDLMTDGNGFKFSFIDMSNAAVVDAAVTPETKMIFLETPTNPLITTTDIRAIADIAKKHNLLFAVDGTFLSPYLQNPLDLGADIVIHSVTKFLAGHSDVLMGVVISNHDAAIKKLKVIQEKMGAVPSPFECYLTLRGLKTLHLRVDAAQANAQKVAEFMETHPLVEKVMYPGLKSYPQYEIAKKQSRGAGAMLSFYIKGGLPVAGKFLQELKIFALAVSLGAVESLACCPAIMTHGAVPVELRKQIGLTDGLIRLAIGVEYGDDLVADLAQALEKASELYHSTIVGSTEQDSEPQSKKAEEDTDA